MNAQAAKFKLPTPDVHRWERRTRATVQAALADNRRLEFLRALSLRHAPLSGDEILWLTDLLERARLARYHYTFKYAERLIADDWMQQELLSANDANSHESDQAGKI